MDNENKKFEYEELLCFNLTEDIIDDLRMRMPFQLSIDRDEDDKEKLAITSITDKNGNDLADSNIEINIQSLGADERYWLDTGAFDIQ